MISDYYNKTVSTKRLADITATDKEDYQTYIATLSCLIQPLSETFQEDLEGSTGKDYVMFCGVADILEGDRVIDGTDEYSVVGLKRYSDKNAEHHLEVIIRRYKQ
jgi:hypothetical protein